MTVVLGQHFMEGVAVMADCRASISKSGKVTPWRDNTQKVFFLNPEIVLGFAGDIGFAGSIISFVSHHMETKPEFGQPHVFSKKAPSVFKYAYKKLCEQTGSKPSVAFIIAGNDLSRKQKVVDKDGKFAGYVSITEKIVFKMSAPDFLPEFASIAKPNVIIGSGTPGLEEIEKDLFSLQFNVNGGDVTFGAVISDHALRENIKKKGIDTVGGLSQIAVIDNKGPRFIPYQGKREAFSDGELDVEMIIRNGRFVQRDLVTGKEVELLFPPEVVSITDQGEELFADLADYQ